MQKRASHYPRLTSFPNKYRTTTLLPFSLPPPPFIFTLRDAGCVRGLTQIESSALAARAFFLPFSFRDFRITEHTVSKFIRREKEARARARTRSNPFGK